LWIIKMAPERVGRVIFFWTAFMKAGTTVFALCGTAGAATGRNLGCLAVFGSLLLVVPARVFFAGGISNDFRGLRISKIEHAVGRGILQKSRHGRVQSIPSRAGVLPDILTRHIAVISLDWRLCNFLFAVWIRMPFPDVSALSRTVSLGSTSRHVVPFSPKMAGLTRGMRQFQSSYL
jgi:hypothetical protein